jgi:hypothetical protein
MFRGFNYTKDSQTPTPSMFRLYSYSNAEPEPQGAASFGRSGAGTVTRCGSGSETGKNHGQVLKNDTKYNSL